MYNRYISEVNKDVFYGRYVMRMRERESKQLPLESKERRRKGRKITNKIFGTLMRYY